MNLLVIGSGGREHSICYKLRQSSRVSKLFCMPGNAGTEKIAENISQDISNFEDYTSHNTKRLTNDELKEVLSNLDYIKKRIIN